MFLVVPLSPNSTEHSQTRWLRTALLSSCSTFGSWFGKQNRTILGSWSDLECCGQIRFLFNNWVRAHCRFRWRHLNRVLYLLRHLLTFSCRVPQLVLHDWECLQVWCRFRGSLHPDDLGRMALNVERLIPLQVGRSIHGRRQCRSSSNEGLSLVMHRRIPTRCLPRLSQAVISNGDHRRSCKRSVALGLTILVRIRGHWTRKHAKRSWRDKALLLFLHKVSGIFKTFWLQVSLSLHRQITLLHFNERRFGARTGVILLRDNLLEFAEMRH